MHPPNAKSCRSFFLGLGVGFWLGAVAPVAFGEGLRQSLESLAQEAHFTIEGLDQIGQEPGETTAGDPASQIKALLQDYNYLVIQGKPGQIEKVLVSSRKHSGTTHSTDHAYVKTTRVGSHHQVEAMIVGPSAVAKTVALIVDTGASAVVLPKSLMAPLGFAPKSLRDGMSQTANGKVRVKLGTLASIRIGSTVATNVQAAFMADKRLKGAMLLGMSFLSRYRVTIDDAGNELVLRAK